MDRDEQINTIQTTLNQAMKLVSEKRGISWSRSIIITDSISQDERHVGRKTIRLNPHDVIDSDLPSLIENLFERVDMFDSVIMKRRRDQIEQSKGEIEKHLTLLRKLMNNGDFEHFLEKIIED